MMQYSTEPRTRKYINGYGFLSFARNFLTNIENNYSIHD